MKSGLIKLKRMNQENSIYIYGTGLWARNVYNVLMAHGIRIEGFVVTKDDGRKMLFELPVKEFVSISRENVFLVLGMNQHNTKEVRKYLAEQFFDEDRIISVDNIMDSHDRRVGYDEIPTLDVTTWVGCSVDCKFCPQDLFIRKYFESNKVRESILSRETLRRCISNMPQDYAIQFGGFSEPFLNPFCIELIEDICSLGKTIDLYTTLVGLNEEMLRRVMELPINCVCLHIADEQGYAKIPPTEEYYRMLEMAVNYLRADGRPFVDMCNAQAKPTRRALDICRGKYDIPYTLLDRGGNLEGEDLVSKQISSGKISCGVCGSKLNKNELLPDGTVLLCCMDYGMKHVLGNLKEQPYEEIINSHEIQKIRQGMEEDYQKEILCRKCSCANLIDESVHFPA